MTRLRIRCVGAVQGVGFRPTVFRLARSLGLSGWVLNDAAGAVVEVEGPDAEVRGFVDRLRGELPPLARLDGLEVEELAATGEVGFEVRRSAEGARSGALVPPDAALCGDCRREMEDPQDRRHRYPFTTCTNCGPRFSLVHGLPYDRERTAMACFPFCPRCAAEYADPEDRRFHAEPVCCPACGPRLWLADRDGRPLAAGEEAIAGARDALERGAIVAIKGLGGFQLACRADRDRPVGLLRERKHRPTKPFAVMVRDVAAAARLVELDDRDCELLSSARAPVVLAPARRPSPLSGEIAPGIEDLGVLLPTTPLHVELLRDPSLPPLVMTSGNLSDEPICRANREAIDRLGAVADAFLLHDRDVVRRVDDSVVRTSPVGPILIRRARGWVPDPVPLPRAAARPTLAVGGHLQVTACLAVGDLAFPSQHVGDLDSEAARGFLVEVVEGLEEFLQVRAEVVVSDVHPDYPSTWIADRLAEERGARREAVQHHLAHAAAVLGEHRRLPADGCAAVVLALDGTGYGPDGTAWGGEWLSVDDSPAARRIGHLEPLPLVGGERAVHEPWRVAAAALELAGLGHRLPELPPARKIDPASLAEVARLAARGGWPLASGAGRLFEAAGALLGLAEVNGWEGEAAVRLESLASRAGRVEPWPELACDGSLVPTVSLLAAAAERLLAGEPPADVAAGLHATFCRLAAELTARFAPPGTTVAAGGGCLVNRHLVRGLALELRERGLELLLPRLLPPGDGGLAYGQVVAAVGRGGGAAPTAGV